MNQTQLIALAAGLGALALFCLIGVLGALGRRRDFERELAASRAGQYTALVAYQHYTQRNAGRITLSGRVRLIVVVLLVVLVGYLGYNVFEGGGAISAFLADAQYVLWLLAAPILLVPMTLNSLLAGAWADAPAMAQLRNLPTQPRDLVSLRLKNFSVGVLPVFIIAELSAALYAFGVNGAICFFVFLFATLFTYVAISYFNTSLIRWYYPSIPMAQTQWAALEPRVQAWARLAGIPLRAVYVRQVEKFGMADSSITYRRPQSVFFSDTFLANSDWRQQDAMTSLLLAVGANMRQPRTRRQTNPLRSLATILGAIIVVALLAFMQFFLLFLFPRLPLSMAGLIGFVLPVIIALLFFFALVRTSRRNTRGNLSEQLLARDREAVALCGDPLALMAVLLTTTLLNGSDINRRVNISMLSTRDRITRLEQSLTQPGPFAPWAFQPIPCLLPLQMGPYALSVPLTPQALATPPGPVPWGRLSISESPWAALPMMENMPGAPTFAPTLTNVES